VRPTREQALGAALVLALILTYTACRLWRLL
jgi:hypothetical protein